MNTAVLEEDSTEAKPESGLVPCESRREPCTLEPGQLIGGKYLIHGKLGQGGFAVVYDAEHVGLGRQVAIKVVHLDDDTPLAMLERARREARISALVRHPNVLEVFDSGTLDDGSPYLVMERVHGDTVSTRLAREGFSIKAVADIGCQLLTALDALAKHDIVHRDIKSDNVMLHDPGDGRDVVKLLDFGISKRSGPLEPKLTTDGTLVGTPSYMAPEQLRGEPLDTRTDIYAVGVVLYEALTGHVPHERASLSELFLAALHDKVKPIRQVRAECPRELERIVLKALSREKEERYASALDMRAELEQFARSLSMPRESDPLVHVVGAIEPRPASRFRVRAQYERMRGVLRDWEQRMPALRVAEFAVVTLVLLAGGAARLLPGNEPEKNAPKHTASAMPVAQQDASKPEEAPKPEVTGAHEEPRLLKLDRPEDEPTDSKVDEPDIRPDQEEARDERKAEEKRSRPRRERTHSVATRVVASSSEASTAAHPPVLAMGVAERKNPKELMREALAAYALGRYALTQQLYRKVTQLAPDEAAAFRGLGLVATRLGDYGEARRAFERYLVLSPKAPDHAAIRARVQALPGGSAAAPDVTMAVR